MKHAKFAGLLSLFAILSLAASGGSAQAATCTLVVGTSSASGNTIFQPPGGSVPWTNNVSFSDSTSHWSHAEAHFNNLTTGTTNVIMDPAGPAVPIPSGGGTYPFSIHFPGSGYYECYVIDSGTAGSGPNTTSWFDSTNHITVTLDVTQ